MERLERDNANLAFGPNFNLNLDYERVLASKVIMVNVAVRGFFPISPTETLSKKFIRDYPQIIFRDSSQTPKK